VTGRGRHPSFATCGAALRRSVLPGLLVVAGLALSSPARSGPFIWDEDGDRIDDRIESVHLLGFEFSFENADTLQRQRFAVVRTGSVLSYSAYIVYTGMPNDSDLASLGLLGMPVLHRYESVPAVRTFATWPQVQAAALLPNVERVEAITLLHPGAREAAAAMGVRDETERAFPTVAGTGGADGAGVVIAFLDTGVNDAPDGGYPGHESLMGRCLGGASFVHADSSADTPRDGSENPVDRGGAVTESHGTHVASLALGTGGASGYAKGVAPGARFVDVKVLNDAGIGAGVAEALDWCVHNRARDWGGPAGYEGIDVVNLSLSSLDPTDGNDLVTRIANRAVELGIVVVASMGNDGDGASVPSPAAGDAVIAIGAFDHQRTAVETDDLVASFNNRGPRASDGDADAFDEQKPDLLAPGLGVLGADGDLASDGAQYHRLSGTSMAAGLASGAVAVLRSADPTLTPAGVASLLRATARRGLGGGSPGPSGPDPRWSASLGFGAIDLYAAELERTAPARSQVVALQLDGSAGDAIAATIRTQRELGAGHFVFERANDEGGAPGSFAALDSAAASGDAYLTDPVNRAAYTRVWTVPVPERGTPFWYRVAFTEDGQRFTSPARRFESPRGPSAATIEVTIVHNEYDHDIHGAVRAGAALGGAPVEFPLPGTTAAVASDWVTGASAYGNVAWTFRIEVPQGAADAFLPPASGAPWRLDVEENGYLNRSGRVTGYRITWHGPEGDETFEGGPVPQLTLEGQATTAYAPQGVTAVGPSPVAGVRFGPNPVRAGAAVAFAWPRASSESLSVYDVTGRRVAQVGSQASGAEARANWRAVDGSGRPLASGVYLARAGAGPAFRLVVVQP
jgi:hypothetical protein